MELFHCFSNFCQVLPTLITVQINNFYIWVNVLWLALINYSDYLKENRFFKNYSSKAIIVLVSMNYTNIETL